MFLRSALALFALLLVEGVLQLVSLASPRVAFLLSPGIERTVPDAHLRRRPNPEIIDHDAAGWRNPSVLTQADIVALGDSQTYGDEVSSPNAWPLRLGAMTGASAYNMAFSGFGPVDYYLLAPEAIAKRPKVIVLGLYSGNDFANAYAQGFVNLRAPELIADDEVTREALSAATAERPKLGSAWHAARAARRGWWKTARDGSLEPLEEKSKLWGLIRGLDRLVNQKRHGPRRRGDSVREDFDSYAESVKGLALDHYFPVRGPNAATVLTPGRREALDLEDPRIAVGMRVVVRVAMGIRDLCGDRCKLVVVLIPTKELVFEDEVAASGLEPPAAYRMLLPAEKRLWRTVAEELEAEAIDYVEVVDALRAAAAQGRNPYLSDWDGHPNVVGNEVIAREVAKYLTSQSAAGLWRGRDHGEGRPAGPSRAAVETSAAIRAFSK